MKKIILLVLSLTIFVFSCILPLSVPTTYADESIYAKVEKNGVYLYSKPNSNESNKLFELPNSYFVRLLKKENDEFFYCSYKDVNGYVKISEVIAMSGKPQNPFIEASFRVYLPEGIGLYSSPTYSDQYRQTTIPYLTDTLTYYGTITGQEAIPDKSSVWIYCKFSYDRITYGYVYSVFCDKLPSISTNNERFNIVDNPFFSSSQKSTELTSVAMGFILVGVSLPCLIVLYLLIRPTWAKEKVEKSKPKLRAKRNKDYFEFDESDLN